MYRSAQSCLHSCFSSERKRMRSIVKYEHCHNYTLSHAGRLADLAMTLMSSCICSRCLHDVLINLHISCSLQNLNLSRRCNSILCDIPAAHCPSQKEHLKHSCRWGHWGASQVGCTVQGAGRLLIAPIHVHGTAGGICKACAVTYKLVCHAKRPALSLAYTAIAYSCIHTQQ